MPQKLQWVEYWAHGDITVKQKYPPWSWLRPFSPCVKIYQRSLSDSPLSLSIIFIIPNNHIFLFLIYDLLTCVCMHADFLFRFYVLFHFFLNCLYLFLAWLFLLLFIVLLLLFPSGSLHTYSLLVSVIVFHRLLQSSWFSPFNPIMFLIFFPGNVAFLSILLLFYPSFFHHKYFSFFFAVTFEDLNEKHNTRVWVLK